MYVYCVRLISKISLYLKKHCKQGSHISRLSDTGSSVPVCMSPFSCEIKYMVEYKRQIPESQIFQINVPPV